ncbi:cell division protein FtsX [Salipaludibacillus keqinensis]|jgi:cell division transport system permease protein|uniref:Cell division protein FtsX n=1 Tax=Salipaludibacillus keqinensis TaxID=2045207 RepID=A0A323TCN4_9BACI|nr:permease-like cell division protein FtsX [Salipaludibacillus keqinensis]PYZ92831.1 cell division protein FtsX [Salipaludibacillus keqinensis]
MKARTMGRHMKEGSKNIVRNGWMTFASVSAVTVTLLVVGAFLLLIMNLNHFANSLEDDVEIRVFVDLTASEEEQDDLRNDLQDLPDIQSVDYIPKDEGLEAFIDSLGEQGDYFESLRDENPLNDTFVVRADDPQETELIAVEIEELDHVEGVEYGRDIFDQLFSATDFVRIVGIVLIAGLLFTAIFLIANTIKLTIHARRTEIQIMKLVGATNSFIRWPFFIEGLLLGTFGAIIPVSVLAYGYHRFYETIGENTGLDFFEFLPTYPLIIQTAILLLGIGAIVGVWGSVMSVRKFLKV